MTLVWTESKPEYLVVVPAFDFVEYITTVHVPNEELAICSATHDFLTGRIDIDKLMDKVPFDIDGAGLWFCGPPPLRVAIEKGMKSKGKRFASVKYELFEFR